MRRLQRRKAEHLVLASPFSRQIGEASNSHSMREPARDSCFDEIGGEEGKRDRHVHLADAAALTLRNGFRVCCRIRGKLGEPTTSPGNRCDQCGARFRPDRTNVSWRHPLRQENFAAPFSYRLLPGPAKRVRCAIYTRVSTDQGLDQDFNSLDAQYDASQAYIRSQAHAGWTLLRAKYDAGSQLRRQYRAAGPAAAP